MSEQDVKIIKAESEMRERRVSCSAHGTNVTSRGEIRGGDFIAREFPEAFPQQKTAAHTRARGRARIYYAHALVNANKLQRVPVPRGDGEMSL